ncbi:hypothetical protein C1646_759717 [Rhizophagus diaphanus]|nr:hypothetical protein C1646_759717 [Rhizophagus diaphanus] [Rhizophagus sp. MUCL 43196]
MESHGWKKQNKPAKSVLMKVGLNTRRVVKTLKKENANLREQLKFLLNKNKVENAIEKEKAKLGKWLK